VRANRPVFLNLWRIKFPVTAIISILHRISGVIIFLGLPFLLYTLHRSLLSQDHFDQLLLTLNRLDIKLLLWIIASAFCWHFLSGVRHLLMDIGWGEKWPAARTHAFFTLGLSVIVVILLGVWICL